METKKCAWSSRPSSGATRLCAQMLIRGSTSAGEVLLAHLLVGCHSRRVVHRLPVLRQFIGEVQKIGMEDGPSDSRAVDGWTGVCWRGGLRFGLRGRIRRWRLRVPGLGADDGSDREKANQETGISHRALLSSCCKKGEHSQRFRGCQCNLSDIPIGAAPASVCNCSYLQAQTVLSRKARPTRPGSRRVAWRSAQPPRAGAEILEPCDKANQTVTVPRKLELGHAPGRPRSK